VCWHQGAGTFEACVQVLFCPYFSLSAPVAMLVLLPCCSPLLSLLSCPCSEVMHLLVIRALVAATFMLDTHHSKIRMTESQGWRSAHISSAYHHSRVNRCSLQNTSWIARACVLNRSILLACCLHAAGWGDNNTIARRSDHSIDRSSMLINASSRAE
jgi:hypothetical protein